MKQFFKILLTVLNIISFILVGYMSFDYLSAIFSGGTEVIGVALTLPIFLAVVGVDLVLSIINLIIGKKTQSKEKIWFSVVFIFFDILTTITIFAGLYLLN
ncbi:MAG: hypothetical protein IKC11_05740 [Clostridia bacterium]|nr:hypothetical protein [Clostridia bacterium]